MNDFYLENSSFRDPAGFLFYQNKILYRQVNQSYSEHYDHLMNSGLYDELVHNNLLITHSEVNSPLNTSKDSVYKIIQPQHIAFISYPYEWSFTQLKQAALITLEIQKIAMKFEMVLKDASAYNIQFKDGKAIFIDTLSFEKYIEGNPWQAYRQFCQHFLAPLALMSHKDIRLGQLSRVYLDGIPLDLASKILPLKTRLMFGLLTHIHAHAKSQKHYQDKKIENKQRRLGRRSFEGIISSLHSSVTKLKWHLDKTEWGDYYSDTNYSNLSFNHKKELIQKFIEKINPKNAWDMGANTGVFSRILSQKDIPTIAFDVDPAAVEKNYLDCIKNDEKNILPLLLDLTNPSPYMGWENLERRSFLSRGPADMILSLALIHHLAISNNLPLEKISEFFAKLCNYLVIEFVPKSDSQVQRLLTTRKDIFDGYTMERFEESFRKNFEILESHTINDSERIIYFMEKKN